MSSGNTDILEAVQAISSIAVRARRAAEARLRGRDLTYAQYGALIALSERDGLSQAELAQALDTDSTTAMVLRGSLEKKRLVQRNDDPSDARIKRIVLTGDGRKLATQTKPEIANLFGSGSTVISETDTKRLLVILAKLKDFAQSLIPTQVSSSGEKRKPGRPRKAETGKAANARAARNSKAAKSGRKPPAKVASAKRSVAAKSGAKAAVAPRPRGVRRVNKN